MPLKDKDNTSTDVVVLEVTYEVYLKHRDMPVLITAAFELAREHFIGTDELDVLMHVARAHVVNNIDTHEHRLVFIDARENVTVFHRKEIQGISILAPERDTVLQALEA